MPSMQHSESANHVDRNLRLRRTICSRPSASGRLRHVNRGPSAERNSGPQQSDRLRSTQPDHFVAHPGWHSASAERASRTTIDTTKKSTGRGTARASHTLWDTRAACARVQRRAISAYGVITWFNTAEALAPKVMLPLYVAVIGCGPAASFVVVKLALPAASGTVASTVAPSLKVTVPVGVAVASVMRLRMRRRSSKTLTP